MPVREAPLTPPAAASLVLSFVNNADRFTDASGLNQWLRQHGGGDKVADHAETSYLVTDADAATAREFSSALITLLLAHAGRDEPAGAIKAERYLRRFGRSYPLMALVTAEGVNLVPVQDGVAGRFAGLLAAVNDLTRRDAWERVKACCNPPCEFGFYDRTRNLSARYCNTRTCGAQVATRSYRSRNRPSLLPP
jgi:predicted RNA-binding Zn ribbon-like protein